MGVLNSQHRAGSTALPCREHRNLIKAPAEFWGQVSEQDRASATPPWHRFSLKRSEPSPRATLALRAPRMCCVPGPSMLYGALQCLQYSQPGFLLRAVPDLQVAQDHSLQPLQVPHYQDAKAASTKKDPTLRKETEAKARARPAGRGGCSHLRTKAGRVLA